jgi:hypothetical protein
MKTCLLPLTLLGAILLMTTGCNTVDKRISQRQAVFDALPPNEQERIRAGRIDLGDSQDAVFIALGTPQEKRRRAAAEGTSEVWIYTRQVLRPDGFAVTGYSRRVIRDGTGRIIAVTFDPLISPVSRVDIEPVLSVIFRDGVVVAFEETIVR